MTDTTNPTRGDSEREHDPYFEPVITLPLKEVKTLEEDENELYKMRAKLFRWAYESDPPEWKERGTGNVKLLQHRVTEKIRIIMRRDKTMKICANHFVEPYMKLEPNCGSDRAWVWNTLADLSNEEPSRELLAIRFRNAEYADEFKQKFEECVGKMSELKSESTSNEEDEEHTEKQTNGVKEKDGPEVISEDMQKLSIIKNSNEVKPVADQVNDHSDVQNTEKTEKNGTYSEDVKPVGDQGTDQSDVQNTEKTKQNGTFTDE